MSELKSCPFCCCEMELVTVGRDWFRIKPVDGHEDTCPFGENHEWDCSQSNPAWKDEHIADWNTRAESALTETNRLLNLECEELKGDVEKLKLVLSLMLVDYQCTASICGQEGYAHDYDKISGMAKELLDK